MKCNKFQSLPGKWLLPASWEQPQLVDSPFFLIAANSSNTISWNFPGFFAYQCSWQIDFCTNKIIN